MISRKPDSKLGDNQKIITLISIKQFTMPLARFYQEFINLRLEVLGNSVDYAIRGAFVKASGPVGILITWHNLMAWRFLVREYANGGHMRLTYIHHTYINPDSQHRFLGNLEILRHEIAARKVPRALCRWKCSGNTVAPFVAKIVIKTRIQLEVDWLVNKPLTACIHYIHSILPDKNQANSFAECFSQLAFGN